MLIVKVQLPVAQGTTDLFALVYDREHEHDELVPTNLLPGWLTAAMRKVPKTFAHARWDDEDGWTFLRLAEWQKW